MIHRLFTISMLLAAGISISSCTSLRDTTVHQFLNQQGSYFCAAKEVALPKQNNAEADNAQIRCYQDQWVMQDGKVTYTRMLHSSKRCDVLIGRIVAERAYPMNSEDLRRSIHLKKNICSFIKMNPDWLGEKQGTCLLSKVPLNEKSTISVFQNCRDHIPAFCFNSDTTLSVQLVTQDELGIASSDGKFSERCKRSPQ